MNSTVVDNRSSTGSGGLVIQGGTAILHNTIVANNRDGGMLSDISGSVDNSSSHNLVGIDTGFSGITNGVNGNQIGTGDSPLDPRLAPLEDNGGSTWTRSPYPNSPVLDAEHLNEDFDDSVERGCSSVHAGIRPFVFCWGTVAPVYSEE